MGWFKRLFSKEEKHPLDGVALDSIALGERDENGMSDIYINGEKTNGKMLTFTSERIDELQAIAKRIRDEEDNQS
jgi:hypothetical protein